MKRSTAIGIYLIGLQAKTIAVTATRADEFRIDLSAVPKERGSLPAPWKLWERETRLRVRCALTSLGIDIGFSISFDHIPPFPPHIDLAIVAACLNAKGHAGLAGNRVFLGEVGLHGDVRPVRGVLPSLLGYIETRSDDERSFVVPYDNAIEASHAGAGTNVFAIVRVSELFDLSAHAVARSEYREPKPVDHIGPCLRKLPDRVVRAIEQAAIDGKPIHLIGANADRGVRLLRSILPPMTRDEAIESASLLSIAGLLQPDAIGYRSYRAPHHAVCERGLVGGDIPPRAGEVSLAHNGLLCLFDLPQFGRGKIEVLAPVLRKGKSRLWRRDIRTEFPARARLVTTATRCPCVGEKPTGKHSEFCATLSYRNSDPDRDEFYLGWQTRHCAALGIERIVDADFGPNDRSFMGNVDEIRERVRKAIKQ
jgi:magnesium chelatase family protein